MNPLNYSFKQQPQVNVNKKHEKRWRKKVSCLKTEETTKREKKVKEKGGSPIKIILWSRSRSHREIKVCYMVKYTTTFFVIYSLKPSYRNPTVQLKANAFTQELIAETNIFTSKINK